MPLYVANSISMQSSLCKYFQNTLYSFVCFFTGVVNMPHFPSSQSGCKLCNMSIQALKIEIALEEAKTNKKRSVESISSLLLVMCSYSTEMASKLA